MTLQPITRDAPPLSGRAIASQRWSELTFVHWRIDSAAVAPLLPAGLRPDEFDGSSWVGLIPFLLDRATLFGSAPVPYLGRFVELNVRLYAVDGQGRRGVLFRSLEASRLGAVAAARAAFNLPYFWSDTWMSSDADLRTYGSKRPGGGPRSSLTARIGHPVEATPLDDFLTARWGMFTSLRGRTRFVPNEHPAWALRSATLMGLDDELVAAAGLPGIAGREPDSVRFSHGVTTTFGRPVNERPDKEKG